MRSSFSPDEFWQSLEVAHRCVFGYGYLTWEWWDEHQVRSIAHPFVYAVVYFALKVLGIDYPGVVAYAPRVLQSVLLAVVDWSLYKTAAIVYGKHNAEKVL